MPRSGSGETDNVQPGETHEHNGNHHPTWTTRPLPWDAHYESTETSMCWFNISEHGIDCMIYYRAHPALKVTYGGIMK